MGRKESNQTKKQRNYDVIQNKERFETRQLTVRNINHYYSQVEIFREPLYRL